MPKKDSKTVKAPFLKRWLRRMVYTTCACIIIIGAGFAIPERIVIPVQGATHKDWNPKSFWYYPWGNSGVHRGIDIFAAHGQPVIASTSGMVVYAGVKKNGGHAIMVLGPKWRLHYYAHLSRKSVRVGYYVKAGEPIGAVGSSGNAMGKQPHLHYSIRTLFPYFWRSDESPYGSQKKWYLNPIPRFSKQWWKFLVRTQLTVKHAMNCSYNYSRAKNNSPQGASVESGIAIRRGNAIKNRQKKTRSSDLVSPPRWQRGVTCIKKWLERAFLIYSKSATEARSSRNSCSVTSIFSRSKSLMSSPWTISYSPSLHTQGYE